jgi:hypothetical protein
VNVTGSPSSLRLCTRYYNNYYYYYHEVIPNGGKLHQEVRVGVLSAGFEMRDANIPEQTLALYCNNLPTYLLTPPPKDPGCGFHTSVLLIFK